MSRPRLADRLEGLADDLSPGFAQTPDLPSPGDAPAAQLMREFDSTPFDRVTLDLPGREDTVDVLAPRRAPDPPHAIRRRGVKPAEAIAIVSTSGVDFITPETDALPDVIITPGDVAGEICL